MPTPNKHAIFARTLPRESVDVPEWGGVIYVRGMTAAERERWANEWYSKLTETDRPGWRAAIVAWCATDENGTRIFDDADIAELAKQENAAIERLWQAIARQSGVLKESLDEAKKNYAATSSGG